MITPKQQNAQEVFVDCTEQKRDYILFYEYFHGDNGAGLGASHQTGWTGLIARSLDMFARLKPEEVLEISKDELAARMTREQVAGR